MRDLIKPYAKRLPCPCPSEEMKRLALMGKKKILEYLNAYEKSKKIRDNLKRKLAFPANFFNNKNKGSCSRSSGSSSDSDDSDSEDESSSDDDDSDGNDRARKRRRK